MVITYAPIKAIEVRPSAQEIADKLMKTGLSLEDTVDALRKEGYVIAQIDIGGKPTYWTYGRSFGEDVFHSLVDQGHFIRGQRMCEEQMVPSNYGQLPECYKKQ